MFFSCFSLQLRQGPYGRCPRACLPRRFSLVVRWRFFRCSLAFLPLFSLLGFRFFVFVVFLHCFRVAFRLKIPRPNLKHPLRNQNRCVNGRTAHPPRYRRYGRDKLPFTDGRT